MPSWARGVELGPHLASAYPSGSDSWFAEEGEQLPCPRRAWWPWSLRNVADGGSPQSLTSTGRAGKGGHEKNGRGK